ncbi:MAG: hypothetical protein ACREID_03290 [Planctomycetota bacterium]
MAWRAPRVVIEIPRDAPAETLEACHALGERLLAPGGGPIEVEFRPAAGITARE